MNVSITSGKDEYVNAGQLSVSSSTMSRLPLSLPVTSISGFLLQMLAFCAFAFL